MNLPPQRALILGLGSSGEAAAQLLLKEGWPVTVVDQSNEPAQQARAEVLRSAGADVRLGDADISGLSVDVAVTSPGIPVDAPWHVSLRERAIPILPEFELGWACQRGKTIAITGSNGKSTMTKWIADVLNLAGQSAVPCGNFGRPVCAVVRTEKPDWLVMELSSFQLEQHLEFCPDMAVLLNLVPNHLDRHGTMAAYTKAKARIFEKQTPEQAAIVPGPLVLDLQTMEMGEPEWITFGPEDDYRWTPGAITGPFAFEVDLTGTLFDNPVLGTNAAAACAALHRARVEPEVIERAAREFVPLPHRMERVGEWGGVTYINDSKATTLTAMAAALQMCRGKVRLIAGGLLKETDLQLVRKMLAEKAAGVYLIGRSSEAMNSAWSGAVSCHLCGTLVEAVDQAVGDARTGEIVLLSPGCASFDQFRSYEQRGQQFRETIFQRFGETTHG